MLGVPFTRLTTIMIGVIPLAEVDALASVTTEGGLVSAELLVLLIVL